MKNVAAVTAILLLITLALAVVYPLYPCDGIYCAKDGTSFWNPFNYAEVEEYNKSIK